MFREFFSKKKAQEGHIVENTTLNQNMKGHISDINSIIADLQTIQVHHSGFMKEIGKRLKQKRSNSILEVYHAMSNEDVFRFQDSLYPEDKITLKKLSTGIDNKDLRYKFTKTKNILYIKADGRDVADQITQYQRTVALLNRLLKNPVLSIDEKEHLDSYGTEKIDKDEKLQACFFACDKSGRLPNLTKDIEELKEQLRYCCV